MTTLTKEEFAALAKKMAKRFKRDIIDEMATCGCKYDVDSMSSAIDCALEELLANDDFKYGTSYDGVFTKAFILDKPLADVWLGTAKRSPNDNFDQDIGVNVAMSRALVEYFGCFI